MPVAPALAFDYRSIFNALVELCKKQTGEDLLPEFEAELLEKAKGLVQNLASGIDDMKSPLHDEGGHKADIVNYMDSVIYSDSKTIMKRWRDDDKKLVVETLSEKADGMFWWAVCQLKTLRQCFPQCLRRTLDELPESLADTYERVLMEIEKTNQAYTYRMLQCLAVAARPLSVTELAELLAFDFEGAKNGIPKLNSGWRWEDHEQAVLSTCSGLVTVIPGHGTPIVQFSHYSVKDFLLSDRLAKSMRDISRFHISLDEAHTLLAQTCLGVLLHDPDVNDSADSVPLDRYAAEHWVTHAQVGNVASRVRDGMKYLFDSDKPHFEAWVRLHNVDTRPYGNGPDGEPGARQLYYAALCGFHELVEHLVLKYPKCASARGGNLGTALHSASFAGHFRTVQSLLRHGAGVDVRNGSNYTPLGYASREGHRDVVQCLIDHGADVNSQQVLDSSLSFAAFLGHVDVVQVLLERGADVNFQGATGRTALHFAINGASADKLGRDYSQVVLLLQEHGAKTNARDICNQTPLHLVCKSTASSKLSITFDLLEHGADENAKDLEGRTPLQVALAEGQADITQLISEFRSGRWIRTSAKY